MSEAVNWIGMLASIRSKNTKKHHNRPCNKVTPENAELTAKFRAPENAGRPIPLTGPRPSFGD
jgi:hypothetical protein